MAHILVIEADPNLRAAVVTILELAGYEVSSAPDGAAGVAKLAEQSPDLVLCDMTLPFVNGYGVLQRLRRDSHTRATPLIFLTAHLSKADLQKSNELGANAHLINPFTEAELLEVVRNHLPGKYG